MFVPYVCPGQPSTRATNNVSLLETTSTANFEELPLMPGLIRWPVNILEWKGWIQVDDCFDILIEI